MSNKATQFKPGNPGGPGRPPGTRNIETLFRDAIKKIQENGKVEDMERDLIMTIFQKAKQGDMKAMEMYLDRLYGKPVQKNDNNNTGEITIKWDANNSSS